ncbi:hypothetical protein LCGC14_0918360 [marine sediment metagenome]|uniref:Uncharacterized protein n=1 Tax=marine sediment metagenome TaxID=412755 RepID=A0A0F9NWD3_9ZZZZ|nr:hypothetical protein [bacterium]
MAKQAVKQLENEARRWFWSTVLTFLAGASTELLHQAITLQEMGMTGIKMAAFIGIAAAIIRAGFKAINEKLIVKR